MELMRSDLSVQQEDRLREAFAGSSPPNARPLTPFRPAAMDGNGRGANTLSPTWSLAVGSWIDGYTGHCIALLAG